MPSVINNIKSLFFLLAVAILLFSCSENGIKNKDSAPSIVSCTVECADSLPPKSYHKHAFSDGNVMEFKVGGIPTNAEAYNGTKSVLLTQKHQYGLNVKIDDVKLNEYLIISVWRKDKSGLGGLIVESNNVAVLYKGNTKTVEKGENGWEKIETRIEVPPHTHTISIYAFIARADSAYFDNLTIKRFDKIFYADYKQDNILNLYFTDKKVDNFEKARVEAFAEGVHFNYGNWNKGILSTGEDVLPVKARFKGDWLDHLMGTKWSFRIKVRKGKTFNRMREFSFQTPSSRFFMHEYLSHQLFLNENLLTTRYDFAPLYFNQESRGMYAIEEHFTKQLVESSLRREGPILKLDEDPMWRNIALHRGLESMKGWENMPNYEVSRVLPFGSSKVVQDPKLRSQFLIGQSLLLQLKYRKAPVEEIFEIDKLAKFLALRDLHQGHHGDIWHNMRFYYNPISCKLELVNYDNFTDDFKLGKNIKPLAYQFNKNIVKDHWSTIYPYLFTSRSLTKKYIEYLEEFTNRNYLMNFYNNQKAKIDEYLPLIKEEFPSYHIDSSYLLNNAEKIRSFIPELKKRYASNFYDSLNIKVKKEDFSTNYIPKLFPYYLNSYYYQDKDQATLFLENFNNRKVKPVSLLDKKKRPIYSFTQDVVVDKFLSKQNKKTTQLPYFKDAAYLVFEDMDQKKAYTTELTLWAKNTKLSPYQQLIKDKSSNFEQLFTVKGDSLLLKKGNYSLKNKLYIPTGKTVIFEAGAKLDLTNSAAIVSYSALQFRGTQNDSITVYSSDNTANGIVVLQASTKSKVEYTGFSNLNTFSYKNWNLSGAVNFYESEVEINHCTFEKNHCEDALNIIRTDFNVTNCKFLDIFADAFDSDFCTGILSKSSFDRVGNDAIDFSTSQIKIEDCDINNISDKGVSGGEGSTLWVKNTTINNSNIGAASKDLSQVYLTNVEIKNSNYGLVLLKKKPEYGPAYMETKELVLTNCEEDLLIEKKSEVDFNGKKMIGSREKVAEMFY